MRKVKEVLTRKDDGTFTYGRTIVLGEKAKYIPNPVCPGTMTVMVKSGNAYIHIVVDRATEIRS